jgi:hypothetical protein
VQLTLALIRFAQDASQAQHDAGMGKGGFSRASRLLSGQQVGEKENETSKQDSQEHRPKPSSTSSFQPAVRLFRDGADDTEFGRGGPEISSR